MSSVRILLVDDFEPWRRVASSTLNLRSDWQVVDQASNGAGKRVYERGGLKATFPHARCCE